jgi:hypothetical protein
MASRSRTSELLPPNQASMTISILIASSLEDYDLWLRCVKAGARIVHVPDAVYCAHKRPGSRNEDQSVYAQLRAEHAEVWAR